MSTWQDDELDFFVNGGGESDLLSFTPPNTDMWRSEAGGEFAGQEAAQQPTAPSDMGTHQPQNWQQQEQQQHHGTHERDREHEQQHPTMVGMDGSPHAAGQQGREVKMERDVGKGAMPHEGMMRHHLVQVKDEKGGDMHNMMSQQGRPRAHIPQHVQQHGLAQQQQSWDGGKQQGGGYAEHVSADGKRHGGGGGYEGQAHDGVSPQGTTRGRNAGGVNMGQQQQQQQQQAQYNGGGHQNFSGTKQQSASGGDGQYFVPSKSGVIMSGWLHKKAATSWGWRKRWFILYPSSLHYCTSPDLKGIMKTISFSGMGSVEAVPSEFEFKIFCQGKCFVLKAETAGEKSEWLFAFQSVLGNGPPQLMPGVSMGQGGQAGGGAAGRYGSSGGVAQGAMGMSSSAAGGLVGGMAGGKKDKSPQIKGSGGGAKSGGMAKQQQQQQRQQQQQQPLPPGSFSASTLKRKIQEAMPGMTYGAPTPALSQSNPNSAQNTPNVSRDNSAHGVINPSWHHGGTRSLDTSFHGFQQGQQGGGGSQHGRRSDAQSRETSLHGGRGSVDGSTHSLGIEDDRGIDDSGKRVKADPESMSKTLKNAGQQAVELTMRYLAHMLFTHPAGHQEPFDVHEVMFATHEVAQAIHKNKAFGTMCSSQFLTSVVLRGLLVRQQMDPDGWPEVIVNTSNAEFTRFSQYITANFLELMNPLIEVAPEAQVLPPVLLPLLTLIEVCQKSKWPMPLSVVANRQAFITALSKVHVSNQGQSPDEGSSSGGGTTHTSCAQSPMEPLSPGGSSNHPSINANDLATSRAFQDLVIMSPQTPSTPHNHPIKEPDEMHFNGGEGGKGLDVQGSPFLSLAGDPAPGGGAAAAAAEAATGRGGGQDDPEPDAYGGEMGVFVKGGSADAESFWACLGDEPALGA